MTSFIQKLENRVKSANTLLCIGLDPHVSQLSESTPASALEFCKAIISSTHQFAAAFKPNSAFFECFGEEGFRALKEVIEFIPKDIPIILDCKRGDIDTTAQAYANAAFSAFNADCVTLSPYMGWNSIEPFVAKEYSGKGAFVLCKTSNPSSKEIQELKLQSGEFMYEKVLQLCDEWNTKLSGDKNIGVVAGATDLPALQTIRQKSPDIWILCPGVGAQGGEAHLVCEVGLRKDGSGLLVSVSRNISRASNMTLAAETLCKEINALRTVKEASQSTAVDEVTVTVAASALKPYQEEFIRFALADNALQFGQFTLKSGRISPYFFNAGKFCTGKSMHFLCRCYAQAVKDAGIAFDVVFGPAYKGIPLVTGFAMAWYDLFQEEKDISYNRKEAKDHGEGGILVGAALKGRRVLIIDDVITAGTAIREAVDILYRAEANIVGTVVCLDRQERANDITTTSAIQEVEAIYKFPVISIIQLQHLIAFVQETMMKASPDTAAAQLTLIQSYRTQYGV